VTALPFTPTYPHNLSPGVKRPVREADHSPPFSAEVKNAWGYTSTPPNVFMAWCLVKHRMNLHGVVVNYAERLYLTPPEQKDHAPSWSYFRDILSCLFFNAADWDAHLCLCVFLEIGSWLESFTLSWGAWLSDPRFCLLSLLYVTSWLVTHRGPVPSCAAHCVRMV